jgi:hypothetical protein
MIVGAAMKKDERGVQKEDGSGSEGVETMVDGFGHAGRWNIPFICNKPAQGITRGCQEIGS